MTNQLNDLGFATRKVLVRKAVEASEGVEAQEARYLTLKGLSARDVMGIIRIHAGAIGKLVEHVAVNNLELNLDNTATLAGVMLDQAPDLLGDIIVAGCSIRGEAITDAFETAVNLPVSVQLKAMQAIGELTFVDETPGEFLETVIGMMGGITGLMAELTAKNRSKRQTSGRG